MISFFNSHDEEKMNYTCVVLQMVYSIHICEQKKWYYILANPQVAFGIHTKEKNLILHICELQMVFLIHTCEEKNDVAHCILANPQMAFGIHTKENKMILHIYELTNGFFNSHMWRKKWCCTFVDPQVIF